MLPIKYFLEVLLLAELYLLKTKGRYEFYRFSTNITINYAYPNMKKKIRYQADLVERFIPIGLDKLISDLSNSALLSADKEAQFKQFYTSYISLFHARAHSQLQSLQQNYRPFNPDRDIIIKKKTAADGQLKQLKTELYSVLEKANYERLSEKSLNEALNKISPHGVKVSVDFDEFVEVSLFYRGSAIQTKLHSNWKKLKFKKQPVDVQIYRRLFVLLQPKNRQQWIEHLTCNKNISLKKAEKKADAALKALGISSEEDFVYMKLFKDIPRADLEMLFPNTKIQIRLFDKIKLGIMGGGGTAGGIMATISKFSAAIEPVSALIAIGGLIGVLWRQIAKVFSQRAKYSAVLTKNLYFYNLNNNMGTLTYLFNTVEAAECKEVMLAYFFLLTSGESSRGDLDKSIENYIQEKYAIPMNFDINDGLEKLKSSELLSRSDELISVVPLSKAIIKLKKQWNDVLDDNVISISED